jgi:uncharacterized heparinase superfamily protein
LDHHLDQMLNRLAARRAAWSRPATGFVSSPEPVTIGQVARGRQLLAGNIFLAGTLVEAPGAMIWDAAPPGPFMAQAQGCTWLDDLAALGDTRARERAQAWVMGWIARYGRGAGPGWTPDLTGRRLIRWINHAIFLLRGADRTTSERFFQSLGRQTIFLSRRWQSAPAGLPRFESLTGLIHAGLSLTGMEALAAPAVAALARDCDTRIDRDGGIASRNPEDLLEIFTLLNWAIQTLTESGQTPPLPLLSAVARIAPTLRALRHADGGLARFHGGGRGPEGRLDQALAQSGIKARPGHALHMGFARLAAGRTTLILDASPPPGGDAATIAHASTLAFEMTSGRRPVVVNCGSGASFGAEWHRAGRATPSHSTLCLTGLSSSRFGGDGAGDRLTDRPASVPWELTDQGDSHRIEAAHDGWARTHGLTHARTIDLTLDGRAIAGEDLLTTLTPADDRRLAAAIDGSGLQGVAFAIRFHLHPEVEATLDLGGAAISLALKSGEVWIFRQDGNATMTLEPSVYLEPGRLRPRATRQILLAGRVLRSPARVRWSLAKAQDTPSALRDLAQGPDGEEA